MLGLSSVWGISRKEKLANVQRLVMSSQYGGELPSWDGRDIKSPANLIKFGFENMKTSFDLAEDQLPEGRQKLIHPLGSTAPVSFEVTDTSLGLTGVFAEGADSCITRISVAANPGDKEFVPGMAIKCFIDGNAPSVNFITMFSLDGQKNNFNVFANSYSNIIDQPNSPALKFLVATVFSRASKCPNWISVAQFSRTSQDGKSVATPSFPSKILLKPTSAAQAYGQSAQPGDDLRKQLAQIPSGTQLWDVIDSKSGKKFAEISTTGSFVASQYSDERLFFQHERGEVDGCSAAPSS